MKRGFSLVELSIVLVILGLLVGGILAGKSLIRASELRSITSDVSRYKAAFMAYRDKYLAAPGDQTNTYDFFGAAIGCSNATTWTGTCSSTSPPPQGGCNGNGNGMVNLWKGSSGDVELGSWEGWRAWQVMALAGLIEGNYSGRDNPADATGGGTWCSFDSLAGTNVPVSKIAGAAFQWFYILPGSVYYSGDLTPLSAGQYIGFGVETNATSSYTEVVGGILKSEEAWNIDSKLDDGVPSTGTVAGRLGTGGTPPASYPLSDTSVTFSLLFKL